MMVDIEADRLSFTYPSGVMALREVSLKITGGECTAIIGQNGAGKTTLVKHFNGLLKGTTGRVTVGERDARQHSTAQMAQWVGYVFQNPDDQLFQSTVKAEVMFGPINSGWEKKRVEEQTARSLEMVDLGGSLNRHPYDLSPGERKRVALAAVLAMDTPIVVLDEPTTGQDFAGIVLVSRIVESLKSQGKTVIAITHDIDFCAEHFERTILMADGSVLLDGPARSVLSQAEILAQSFVEPPQMMRLAGRLELSSSPLTVEEFVTALTEEFKGDES
jgi:energy-coupling factor transport system ATP-binding protein